MDSTCLKLEPLLFRRSAFQGWDIEVCCQGGRGGVCVCGGGFANVAKGMLMSQRGANLQQHSQST